MTPLLQAFALRRRPAVMLMGLGLVCVQLGAQAEGLEPENTLTYNVGALSDYRVRGIAQTSFQPAVQGGLDWANRSGVYAGVFGSNVRWVKELNGATRGSAEVDLYGGFRGAFDELPFTYDVGVITYQYPGNNSGVAGAFPAGTYSNANTTEIYASVSYKIYTLKLNRSAGNFLGSLNSSGSLYLDLSAALDLGNSFSLTPHIGRQTLPNQDGDAGNYTDLALTLAKDFGNGLVASAMATRTNANTGFYTDTNGRYLGKSALVLGLKYSF